MKLVVLFIVLATVSSNQAEEVREGVVAGLPEIERAKVCVKVKTSPLVERNTERCKPFQVRTLITLDISVPPVLAKIRVTLKCFKPKRARRVTRRDTRCFKVFMKRCRCVEDALKLTCIRNQINTCAPQAGKETLMLTLP